MWKGSIKGEDIVATVHGDDIIIGGVTLRLHVLWTGRMRTQGMLKARVRVDVDTAQTKREWVDAKEGDDRDRPRMADDDDNDSQALTGGDITWCRALVARISYLSQDRPDLKFASVRAKRSVCDMERVKRIGRYLAGKPRAKCWFRWQQSGELEAYSDAGW